MATVVNVSELGRKMEMLGWTNLSVQEVVDGAKGASIPASELMAYLNAAIASPNGFDDQTISGCTASNAGKITLFLRGKSMVAT